MQIKIESIYLLISSKLSKTSQVQSKHHENEGKAAYADCFWHSFQCQSYLECKTFCIRFIHGAIKITPWHWSLLFQRIFELLVFKCERRMDRIFASCVFTNYWRFIQKHSVGFQEFCLLFEIIVWNWNQSNIEVMCKLFENFGALLFHFGPLRSTLI